MSEWREWMAWVAACRDGLGRCINEYIFPLFYPTMHEAACTRPINSNAYRTHVSLALRFVFYLTLLNRS